MIFSEAFFSRQHSVGLAANADKDGKKTNVQTYRPAPDEIWQTTDRANLKAPLNAEIPPAARILKLNRAALADLLRNAPLEFKSNGTSVILPLPLPDGKFANFRVEESSVLEPALAAKFPEIKSYIGQGVENPALTTRFDLTPQGFHALILDAGKPVSVAPASANDESIYASFADGEIQNGKHECLVKDFHEISPGRMDFGEQQLAIGGTLRTYRIAIAATFEYTQNYGVTNANVISSFNTRLTLTNAIYERDLAVRLILVNAPNIIYSADNGFTAATDPYTNSNVGTMLNEVIPDLQTKVGTANYDLGHVLGTTGGGASGVAYVGVVCQNNTFGLGGAIKGGGATQVSGAVGDLGILSVYAHEFGHQFGANHNFNGTLGNCSSTNRNAATSFETGSGSTMMAYGGICGADNLAGGRDLRFHAMSYQAINNYISSTATCSTNSATGNTPPTVSGGGNRTIPRNTPFTLTATGSDPNGDSLTYNWEQIDAGGNSYPQNGTEASYNDAADPATTTRPIFRAFSSTTSPARTFPSLTYILNNANDPPLNNGSGLKIAEELPRVGRTLNFRITARDNRAGGGGVNEDTVVLTVDGSSGPFLVTSPNGGGTLNGGLPATVTWSVNNTNVAPVSAANVRILFSTDGGNTFPTVLAASTANDGSESVVIPSVSTSTARIRVEAVGNIFFDVSDANFSVSITTAAAVEISGRVLTPDGRSVARATVSITDQHGTVRKSVTNAFGYFRFEEISAGQTYFLAVEHKRYNFPAQTINVAENINDLNIVALP